MQRRSLDIVIIFFAVTVCAQADAKISKIRRPSAEASKEEYDCGHDDVTDSWFCNSGPLEGREFVNKSELDEAIEAHRAKAKAAAAVRPEEQLPPDPQPAQAKKEEEAKAEPPGEPRLKVLTWNVKALANEDSDYDRAALILAKADVIALQEVDLRGQGKGFLNVIGNLIQAKTQEKICRAWVHSESGERQTYGFLWKEASIGFVDNDGGIQESCGDTATIIRQGKKNKLVSQATFYFKPQKKMFVLGTAFMTAKPKAPDKSMNDLFKTLDEGKWPIVLAGDLKMRANNPAFTHARKLGFHSAVEGNAKGWDNVWYRGAVLAHAGQVDLYRQFKDARKEDIKRAFDGVFPVLAEFNLREEVPTDTVSVVSKKSAGNTAKKKSKDKKAKKPKAG